MSRIVRQSKYRHVFGKEYKKENWYEGIRVTGSAFDSNFISVNPKYIAIAWQAAGGGSFAVIPHTKTGKVAADMPLVSGHTGAVQDINWHPFNDNIIASSSEDTTVKIWQIPEGGLTSTMRDPVQDLTGHQKRAGIVLFHPTAANVLASTAADGVAKIWDIETGQCRNEITDHTDQVQCFSWEYTGQYAATSCKDKQVRLLDPRSNKVVSQVQAHFGAKGSRVQFLGNKGRIFTVGFSKMSERQFSIWDPRNFTEPLSTLNLDTSSGMLMPFYDNDTGVMFMAGKGDGNIRYYEMIDEAPYHYGLSAYQSSTPQKGMAMLPKRACDVSKCEITRFYKLTSTSVIPIEMCVPRKGDQFQADIFPDTADWNPTMTASEWFGGATKEPKLVSMKNVSASASSAGATFKASGPQARISELEAENAALKKKVAELEAKLR